MSSDPLPRLDGDGRYTRPSSSLRFDDFLRSAQAVSQYASRLNCLAFNNKLLLIGWFIDYLTKQPNIRLVLDAEVPRGMLGCTAKRRVSIDGHERSLYLILVSARVSHPLLRQFTLAHELGHVLLHGSLLQPGMLVRRSHHPWTHLDERRQSLLEVEANVYALMSLIPDRVIAEVQSATDLTVGTLQDVLRSLYGYSLDDNLVFERIMIYDALRMTAAVDRASLRIRFDTFCARQHSWAASGPRSPRQDESGRRKLPGDLLDRIRDRLEAEEVIPPPGPLDDVAIGGLGLCRK